ncbi:hypothetical protein [Streptomyces sp. NPDC091215]|uniref:hypothetical protein n=1 Tax=Streptomyces sp. NPDC091215 TaxID=3155192 RepID=UPI003446D49C
MTAISQDGRAIVDAVNRVRAEIGRLADALTTPVVRTEVVSHGDATTTRRAVPLATPCAACTHPFNWHTAGVCQFGDEETRCSCIAFAVGERVEPMDPVHILGAEASDTDEEQTLRLLRRESLLVLLSRLQRGRPVTEAEADTLRTHVETEIREADTARSVAAGNKRHVQAIVPDLEQAQAAIERARKLASRWAVLRAYGGAATELRRALDGTEPTTEQSDVEALHAKLDEATATLRRVRAVTKDWEHRILPRSEAHRLFIDVRDALAGPRPDRADEPTTEA